jgi:hypothetical protein
MNTTTTVYKSRDLQKTKRNNIVANTTTKINNTQINMGISSSFALLVKANIDEIKHSLNLLEEENKQRKKEFKCERKAKGELSKRVMTLEFELMELRRDLQPKDHKNETTLMMNRLLSYSRDSSLPLRSFFSLLKDLGYLPSSVKTKEVFRKYILASSTNISIYKRGQLECFKYKYDVQHVNETLDEKLILFLLEFSKRNNEISLTMLLHFLCDIGIVFKDRHELKEHLKKFEKIEITKKQGREILIQKF